MEGIEGEPRFAKVPNLNGRDFRVRFAVRERMAKRCGAVLDKASKLSDEVALGWHKLR